jgi:hypothetical protein
MPRLECPEPGCHDNEAARAGDHCHKAGTGASTQLANDGARFLWRRCGRNLAR